MPHTAPHATTRLSRRTTLGGVGAAAATLGVNGLRSASAQDMTTVMAAHPIVGTWLSDNNPEDPGTFVSYAAYHADGTSNTVHPFAGAGIGAWRPTGARTGEALLKYLNAAHAPGEFAEGTVTVSATFEVDPSGTTFTWHAVVEIATPDGLVDTFPSQSIGTRLEIAPISPPGTPTA